MEGIPLPQNYSCEFLQEATEEELSKDLDDRRKMGLEDSYGCCIYGDLSMAIAMAIRWFMVIYGDLYWFMVIYGEFPSSKSSLVG